MKIGFIGLGMMGRGIAANLQRAGNQLVVNDLYRQAASQHLENGATWAATPREVAQGCDVVFTSLPTPADVETVVSGENGLADSLRKGATVFDLSTNSVDVVRALHARLAPQGVDFLDAPISGGPAGAASGKLAIWVGGDKAAFERNKAILDTVADQAHYIGPIGAGTIAKLTHNCASVAMNAVLAEVLTMGVKAGVEPLDLWKAIRLGAAGRLRTFDIAGLRFLPGTFEPKFQMKLMHKDLALALKLGRDVEVPMRMCSLALQEVTEALNRGWGARDAFAFMLLQQERAGVPPIEVPLAEINRVIEQG